MNFCKDCRFYSPVWWHEDLGEIHPELCTRPVLSLVHGTKPLDSDPEMERQKQTGCGGDAIHFIHKDLLKGRKKIFGLF